MRKILPSCYTIKILPSEHHVSTVSNIVLIAPNGRIPLVGKTIINNEVIITSKKDLLNSILIIT